MSRAGRESARGVRFHGHPSADAALAELARRQHVVFGLDQLRELGLTARAVQQRAATGRLHRIHRAVYSLVPRELLKREGLYMAAVLACGPGAVLSHRSAAALHELRHSDSTKIDVTVPGRSYLAHPGVAVHRSTTLTDADVAVVNNIPVTTVARTLFDLGDVVTQRQLERAFDQAEILEVRYLNAINDLLARNSTRPAARKVRKVLAEHYIGKTPTANEHEELLLTITRPLGIPDPDCNSYVVLPDDEPAIKVDFVWREQRVVLESDGRKTHGTRQGFESDRRRDQRLTIAGWKPLRTTWRQMKFRPHELRAVLIKLLPRSTDSRAGPRKPAVGGAQEPGRPHKKLAGGSTSSPKGDALSR